MDNFEMNRIFSKLGGEKFLKNYIGIFASDEFNMFEKLATGNMIKNISSPCAVLNTDVRAEEGTHWVSLISLKNEDVVVVDSLGHLGFKNFFVDDDLVLLKEVLKKINDKETKKLKDNGNVDLIKYTIDIDSYKKFKNKNKLSSYCRGIIELCISLSVKKDKKKSTTNFYYTTDQLQNKHTSFCGVYCLMFLICLYQNNTIDLKNISNTLNKLFVDVDNDIVDTKKNMNTKIVDRFAKRHKVKGFYFDPFKQ